MISNYLILMSMTCVENAGNDPISLAEVPPPSIQIPLDYDHNIDYSFSGYSKTFTSRRSLPSLIHAAEVVRVFGYAVSIPLQTLVQFHDCPVHLIMLRLALLAPRDLHHHQSLIATWLKPYISVSQSKQSIR
jgi:hypothetical protein